MEGTGHRCTAVRDKNGNISRLVLINVKFKNRTDLLSQFSLLEKV